MALMENDPSQAKLFGSCYVFKLADGKWGKPNQVYFDSPYLDTGLRAYYDALSEETNRKWALSTQYQESGIEPERLVKLAKAVGTQTKLAPIKKKIPYAKWTSDMWDGRRWSRYGKNEDYDISEFDALLAIPDMSKSKLIWDTMNELPECCLIAKVRLNMDSPTRTDNSSLVDRLREVGWVPQKQDGQKGVHFSKPSEAVVELLPQGFSYESQAQWLKAIEFGKSKRDREEAERRREQQATHEYQRKNDAAKEKGFSSFEEGEEVAELMNKDPEGFKNWRENSKQKPVFPERPSRNPERRRKRLAEQYAKAPQKEYDTRQRSVRTSRAHVDPDPYLKAQYTDDSDQMICQICTEEMPFKKRDGEYYFEAVEAFSRDYFPKEHEVQFLALCPLCAAKYQEFVKNDEETMGELHHALQSADGIDVPLNLGEWETSIRFVETHWRDMKTILHVYQE